MKTTLVLTAMLALAVAVPAVSSATHNVCHNGEAQDVNLGIVGVDGPIGERNGEQVCVGGDDDYYQVTTAPPAGTGAAVQVCYAANDAYGACSTSGGNGVILGYTGAAVDCTTATVDVCIWVNGGLLLV